ncbi:hypothetical protein KPL42_15120 [Clostridium gasigenes]|uniref:hypothetical protein n=1 Tax=Clostridium gasigenes TaxID=94869 RepID=UPI001C0E87E1|nr:hypothetical protein [Clostridium gasigenes]MBU3089816.1 hypothetical protein [Clostridium gasigenes]
MKILRKKILIPLGVLSIIFLIAIMQYKSYSTNKAIDKFTTYVDESRITTSTYILTGNKQEYENLLIESEHVILNKDSKLIKELQSKLNQFKEDFFKTNSELANKNITELESIDISELADKESILSKIDDIKNLRDAQDFLNANGKFMEAKDDIYAKLEIIKLNKANYNSDQTKKLKEENVEYFLNKEKTT